MPGSLFAGDHGSPEGTIPACRTPPGARRTFSWPRSSPSRTPCACANCPGGPGRRSPRNGGRCWPNSTPAGPTSEGSPSSSRPWAARQGGSVSGSRTPTPSSAARHCGSPRGSACPTRRSPRRWTMHRPRYAGSCCEPSSRCAAPRSRTGSSTAYGRPGATPRRRACCPDAGGTPSHGFCPPCSTRSAAGPRSAAGIPGRSSTPPSANWPRCPSHCGTAGGSGTPGRSPPRRTPNRGGCSPCSRAWGPRPCRCR